MDELADIPGENELPGAGHQRSRGKGRNLRNDGELDSKCLASAQVWKRSVGDDRDRVAPGAMDRDEESIEQAEGNDLEPGGGRVGDQDGGDCFTGRLHSETVAEVSVSGGKLQGAENPKLGTGNFVPCLPSLRDPMGVRSEGGLAGWRWAGIGLALASLLFGSAGCAVPGDWRVGVPADTIYVGGEILTMAGDRPAYVEALAVRDGRILHSGSRTDAKKWAGAQTLWVDLEGKALLPGFIDGHGHIADYIQQWTLPVLNPPPVGDVTSIEDIRRKLTSHLREQRPVPGRLVVAVGYDDSLLKERRHPTRVDLDAVSQDVPIVILHTSGHLLVANSAALKLAGLTKV